MNKIFLSKNLLKKEILKLKKKSKKIVLVHGVFDVVHLGHIYYFQEAKSYGDILVASITSDRFVKKGLNKPYFSEKDRLTFLSQLSIVDYVYFNDTKDASLIIKTIKPDYYVKGPDYQNHDKIYLLLLLQLLIEIIRSNCFSYLSNPIVF